MESVQLYAFFLNAITLSNMVFASSIRRIDWAMIGAAAILSILSVVLLATAGEGTGIRSLAEKQAMFAVIGLAISLLLSRYHYSVFRTWAGPFFIIVFFLILITLFQSQAIRGAAAWIVLGGARLQPAEFMKVGIVLVLARIIGGNRDSILTGRRLAAALFIVGVPSMLVMMQPDVGTAGLIVLAALGILLIAGMSRKHLLILCGASALLTVLAWNFLLVGYQKERVLVFMDSSRDPGGAGYSVLQAQTAFGSGGLTGRGLGWGPQSRLNFLPEAHTDFIFARIGEELGLVGVSLTLALFGLLLFRIISAARRTSDSFGKTIAVGVVVTILVGATVNIGMNVGLLPVTGVPLPFVSYGGSSLLASYILLGLALSVSLHGETWEESDDEDLLSSASREME